PGQTSLDEPLDEPVLRRVDGAVNPGEDAGETGRRRRRVALLPTLAPVEPHEVEVDAEHEGQYEEGDAGKRPAAGGIAERDEEHRVDEQVGLGVEVAAEHGDATRRASELAVGVVEHRLQLQ